MKNLSAFVLTARATSPVACYIKKRVSTLCRAFCCYQIRAKVIFAIILTVSLGGNANAQSGENAPPQVVDEDYFGEIINIQGGLKFGFYLQSNIEKDGRVVICAVTTNVKRPIEKRVLRAFKIKLNGKVILRSIHWAKNYNIAGVPFGRASTCRTTKAIASSTGNEFSIEIAKSHF